MNEKEGEGKQKPRKRKRKLQSQNVFSEERKKISKIST